jgi:hypothetical protein
MKIIGSRLLHIFGSRSIIAIQTRGFLKSVKGSLLQIFRPGPKAAGELRREPPSTQSPRWQMQWRFAAHVPSYHAEMLMPPPHGPSPNPQDERKRTWASSGCSPVRRGVRAGSIPLWRPRSFATGIRQPTAKLLLLPLLEA